MRSQDWADSVPSTKKKSRGVTIRCKCGKSVGYFSDQQKAPVKGDKVTRNLNCPSCREAVSIPSESDV